MYVASFAIFLEFIGHHHIRSINIVSDNLGSDDTSYDGACMDADSHIELLEI